MHVSWSYAGKLIHKCGDHTGGCGGTITKGTPIMRCTRWYEKKKYVKYYHLQCYDLARGYWFEEHPFVEKVIKRLGRKSMGLDEEDSRKRAALLVSAWRHRQRLRELVNLLGVYSIEQYEIAKEEVYVKLRLVRSELELVGGVPKTWS